MNCCQFHYDGGDLTHRCEGDPPGGDQGGHWNKPKSAVGEQKCTDPTMLSEILRRFDAFEEWQRGVDEKFLAMAPGRPAGATDCPKSGRPRVEDHGDGYRAIYYYVVANFGSEQRPDQTVSEFVIDVLKAVAKGNE